MGDASGTKMFSVSVEGPHDAATKCKENLGRSEGKQFRRENLLSHCHKIMSFLLTNKLTNVRVESGEVK